MVCSKLLQVSLEVHDGFCAGSLLSKFNFKDSLECFQLWWKFFDGSYSNDVLIGSKFFYNFQSVLDLICTEFISEFISKLHQLSKLVKYNRKILSFVKFV